MGLTPKKKSKTLRIPCADENGNEVFICNGQYSSRGIFLSFEMMDEEYCSQHKDDVQEAISAFLPQINALLAEDNLPIIHDPTVR